MPDNPVNPKREPETELIPPGWEKNVPARAALAVKALKELSSKDRRSVLRAFAHRGGEVQTVQQSVMMQATWSAPLPPPELLARYNQIIPNGAERLFAIVEKQSAHRIDLESHVAREQVRQSGRGQIFALTIGVLGLATSAYVAKLGLGAAAGTIASVALGTLAVTFILGKRSENSSRTSKNQPQLPPTAQSPAPGKAEDSGADI